MKMYRPSCAADGATTAAVVRTAPGANTRWTPLLGRSCTPAEPEARCATRSAHMPVALTTVLARTSNPSPVVSSVTAAPVTRPPPSNPVTRA